MRTGDRRRIVLWGLLAIPFYVAADLLAMYAVIDVNSTAQSLLFAPLALQELALAAWMIVRGFRPAAPSTARDEPRPPAGRRRSHPVRHAVRG